MIVSQRLLIVVTDFGDTGLAGAIACILSAVFFFSCNRKSALALFSSFALAAFTVALAKLFALKCSAVLAPWHIHSPSGHAALATAVYGMLAAIAVEQMSGWRRGAVIFAAVALIAGVAVTRVMLDAHTIEEVAAGLLIGGVVFGVMRLAVPEERQHQIDGVKFSLALTVAALLFHGTHINAEAWIHHIAARVGDSASCPFGQ